jgi:hypothetical protein
MISSLISTFELTNRRVLLLSTQKAAIYHWQGGAMGESFIFDVNEEGRDNFERYLSETPGTPVYILVDMFEEEYRRETMPHVGGGDRQAIFRRRRARLFRDTPYFYGEVQGREGEGRKDDRVFFSAITSPEQVSSWVELLNKHKIPMAGINSLPIFTGSLLKSFPEPSSQMLIVSIQSISGLRQTYFEGGEFRISRLVQLPRYGTISYAPTIGEEVEKISRYLGSLRLISDDKPLDIYFLLTGELLGELERSHQNTPETTYHMVDINDMLETSGVDKKVTAPFSDQFYTNELLKKPPRNFYASSSERRYSTMRKMKYWMYAASIVLIIAGAIMSSIYFVDGLTLKQDSYAAQEKANFYAARYSMAKERLPHTPVEPNDLKIAVNAIDEINRYKTTPFEIIRLISNGLYGFPELLLDDMQWLSSISPDAGRGGSETTNLNAPTVPGLPNFNTSQSGNAYYQIAIVNGHFNDFNGDYRQAIETINVFISKLLEQDQVHEVSVINLPLDVSSTASLSGDTKSVSSVANFSLRIVLGVTNDV